MNRWSRWTRQLRARHGRTERGGGRIGMVFQRHLPAGNVLFQRAGSKLQVSVYPRIGITLMASPVAPLPAMRTLPQMSPVYHHNSITQVPGTAWLRQQTPALARQHVGDPAREVSIDRVRATETTFVRTPPRFLPTPVRRAAESELPRVHRMMRVVSQQLSAARTAMELPTRLRLRARREELRQSETPQIMAAPQGRAGASIPAGYSAQPAHDAAMTATHPALPPPPVPPAINVEALTSQVIQQLDRRLIAYRERMGRA